MSSNTQPNPPETALPIQVGTKPGQVQELIEEIGEATSPAQVESEGVLDRDHDSSLANQPVPIITSS